MKDISSHRVRKAVPNPRSADQDVVFSIFKLLDRFLLLLEILTLSLQRLATTVSYQSLDLEPTLQFFDAFEHPRETKRDMTLHHKDDALEAYVRANRL